MTVADNNFEWPSRGMADVSGLTNVTAAPEHQPLLMTCVLGRLRPAEDEECAKRSQLPLSAKKGKHVPDELDLGHSDACRSDFSSTNKDSSLVATKWFHCFPHRPNLPQPLCYRFKA